MAYCFFDQNSAGSTVPNASRGDDVVLKSFDDSNTHLDLSTIQSLPSIFSILIDSTHAIVPPPALLHMTTTGVDDPLTWSHHYGRITKSLLQKHTLQYLLEIRFRNNSVTQLTSEILHSETMTPFIFQNSTVFVKLSGYGASKLTVDQQNEVFIQIQQAFLSFEGLQFVFDELTTPAFTCEKDSSISLSRTGLKLTNPTLTQPYIESVGPYVFVEYQFFLQNIKLDSTPFIQLIRAEKDANVSFLETTPLLASSLNTPFIVCEGAQTFLMKTLKLNSSFVNSASFASAKDSTVVHERNQIQLLKSNAQGAFLHLENSSVQISRDTSISSSAKHGGVLFSKDSSVSISSGTFSNCEAEEGGFAYVIASTLTVTSTSFLSNSAKRGGVFFVDFGKDSSSSLSLDLSTFTANSATNVDEKGVDSGKGGVVYLKGTTSAQHPLVLPNSHFEENTATFGNDQFVEEEVLGETGPDLLSRCGGDSYSRFPHLEIENRNGNITELTRISNFLPFPTLKISNKSSATDADACKWSNTDCKTIQYALQFLPTTYPDEKSLFQRTCVQSHSPLTTEPVELNKHDLYYSNYAFATYMTYAVCLTADYKTKEGVVFTIVDQSRLTVYAITFSLTPLHQIVTVKSTDGRFAMDNCHVQSERDSTTSISPICSVGTSLILNAVSFSINYAPSRATFSAPLVYFAPTPSEEGGLGSGTCDITDCSLINLTFEGTTMFKIETTGCVSFVLRSLTEVTTDLDKGKYITLKGQSFKKQIQPSLWPSNLNTADLPNFLGEDISMDENDKWRNNSLVYWLISPSEEIHIGSDEHAVDHPNCGSSTFKCTALDSAFQSADLNNITILALSMSMMLSSKLLPTLSWLIKSSSETKQGIEFDENGSIEVNDSSTKLSFASIVFTVSQTCLSTTLFVVEDGELSFSSCVIGSEDSSSPHVLPESTSTLIEVMVDGKLTLTDTLIKHIDFSHATLGTAIRLYLGATISSSGTKPVTDISSQAAGSHVLIHVSANLDDNALSDLSDLSNLLKTWGPTLTDSIRFSKDEINEFVVIDTNEEVEELIYRWHPYDNETLFVDRTGGSHSKCGLSVLPCSSLTDSVEKVGAGEVIKVCSGLDETAAIVAKRDLSIMSADDSKKELCVSATCSFTSIRFSLSFTSISFKPFTSASTKNAEATPRSASLFFVDSGSLSLTSCSFSSFELSLHSLTSAKDSRVSLSNNQIQDLTSSADGAFLHIVGGSVDFSSDVVTSCSAKHGGVLFSKDSSVSISSGTFSNCEADEGGVACLVSSTLTVTSTSFDWNSAKRGGVFCVDFGIDSTSSLSLTGSIYTANSAVADETDANSGKGGAIFVNGTTSSETPLVLNDSHFEKNIAAFGNDVFVDESVLGGAKPDLLSSCGGESYSRIPHLEIGNHHIHDEEFFSISNFIPDPSVRVSSSGVDDLSCKWSNGSCQTINYALQFLQTTYPDDKTMFQRQCVQDDASMTTDPVELEKHDLIYSGDPSSVTNPSSLSLSATFSNKNGVVFTINDESRLTVQWIAFHLTRLHQVVTVTSKDGQLAMDNCHVLSESGTTTSISPICSMGTSLILNTISFSPTLTTTKATLSAPLVHFAPTPSAVGKLGSGSFSMIGSYFTNLTFGETTMIELITAGDVTFTSPTLSNVHFSQNEGKYLSLKGQDFRTQLKPEQWDSNLKTANHVNSLLGEDVSMDGKDKWRTGSLVYWLVSPSSEVMVGVNEHAVDHLNCGSSAFQCKTLDSAFRSAGFNGLTTLTLSTSNSLSSKLEITSSWMIKSSSETKHGIEFDENGSIEVANSSTKLSFASIVFSVTQTGKGGLSGPKNSK